MTVDKYTIDKGTIDKYIYKCTIKILNAILIFII